MKKLSYLLKSSRFLYSLYYYIVSSTLRVVGFFLKTNEKLILFNSYGGKKFDDSPRAIYEWMIDDSRFDDYTLVWAVHDIKGLDIPGRAIVLKMDSIKFFMYALKARVWITNSSMERGLNFKKKRTLCFNTWHGTPIKVMGIDIKEENQSFKSKVLVRADVMLAQSQYDIDIFSHAFRLPSECFRMTGLPRNDILANYSDSDAERIRKKLGISKEKTILLYAPTFREYTRGSSKEVILDVPMNLSLWQERLGKEFVVLFRAHYEVAKHMNVDGYPMFIDMSKYPDLNELIIVSDALISDYSSIFFDYSVTHKPMYCFAYDYDEYVKNRGMYISLKEELPCILHRNESSLIQELQKYSQDRLSKREKTQRFQEKYVTQYGYGAKNSCNEIYRLINLVPEKGEQK